MKNDDTHVGLWQDLNINVRRIFDKGTDKPCLLVSIYQEDKAKTEFLCNSFKLNEVEYVAQYTSDEWLDILGNRIEEEKAKLPSGEIVSLYDFSQRFGTLREILI